MMDRSFANQLGIHGECQPLCFQWTNNVTRQDSTSEKVELKIASDVDSAKVFTLKGVRTIADLALPHQKFNINEMLERYDYLHAAGDLSRFGDIAPMILIGQDHISLTIPRETIEHEENEPMATNCKLGWSVHGRGLTSFIENFNYHVCERTDTDDLHLLVKNSFKLEDSGLHVDGSKLSRDDSKALDIMHKSIEYDGHRYEIGMLWKDENVVLPESRSNALKRLYCLEKKLDKNKEFAIRYCQKISEYIQKDYCRKVESPQPSLKEWYLPHFGVFNIHKPEKLRLVFDAASQSKNVCLNDFLLQGPDLVPPLIAVIWRFRRHDVAFGGDIREMFHQVKINPADCVAQRFLFRGMDRERTPDTYEMKVMIFGSVSSPSVAQFVKNFNAKKLENDEIDKAMEKQHYVDDYLDGTNTEEEAVIKIKQIIDVHKAGGFEMVNWISNSKSVLDSLPDSLVSNGVKNLKIDDEHVERVLGLFWNPTDDCFTFSVSFKKVNADIVNGNRTPTKRQVLQVLMSVFDPLQFLGPLIIKGKILLQDIWRSGIDWDDSIGDSLREKWLIWLREVKQIDKFKIPRCYFPSSKEIKNLQLHLFSDASEKAYAAVAYLRFESNNLFRTSFVTGKTRVAPLKNLTIPRMELQAALLASRLAATILKEVDLHIEQVFFWCDSTIVLSWIRSEAKRFKMYVGNRIEEIRNLTDVNSWRWVSTIDNVADKSTRDVEPTGTFEWLNGPKFLMSPSKDWPEQMSCSTNRELEDEMMIMEEVQQINFVQEVVFLKNALPDVNRFSKWSRLVRATAWVLRFVKNLKSKKLNTTQRRSELLPDEISDAENILLQASQAEAFAVDIKDLHKNELKRTSRLYPLSPILDSSGLVRMNGRLNFAPLNDDTRKPIILDAKTRYVKLLILHYHEKSMHFGKEIVINSLREKFWVINVRSAVNKAFYDCQCCKIRKAKPEPPLMGQLPEYRLTPNVRPFTHCGVDYFGPMEIKIGRRIEKRYGVLFTCLTVRAIHLEIAASLTTDSMIMALRRFISRRGCPLHMYSDNGTNLKGADKEMSTYIKQFDQDKIVQTLTTQKIQWHFIPPITPHMGGCWERLIGVVKCALKSVLIEHHPREETLQTLFAEAEALVNSRPLTHISTSPDDEETITPNSFLLGTPSVCQLPGKFNRIEMCSRKQWRIAQALTDSFWKIWVKSYIPTLIKRQKWLDVVKSIKVGDVVVLVDEQIDRGHYPMGIVVATYPGNDQQIRAVDVKTSRVIFKRPVVKIAVLDVQQEYSENHGEENVEN